MPTQHKKCSRPGCPERVPLGQGQCDTHRAEGETRRGTAGQRGYDHRHEATFRTDVLARNPICVLCRRRPSTVADHHPKSRRQLVQLGLDPNDPKRGRGLCKPCHDAETARLQPGGWHAR